MTVQLISLLPLYICYDIIFFHTFHIPLVLLQLISNNRQSTLEIHVLQKCRIISWTKMMHKMVLIQVSWLLYCRNSLLVSKNISKLRQI